MKESYVVDLKVLSGENIKAPATSRNNFNPIIDHIGNSKIRVKFNEAF